VTASADDCPCCYERLTEEVDAALVSAFVNGFAAHAHGVDSLGRLADAMCAKHGEMTIAAMTGLAAAGLVVLRPIVRSGGGGKIGAS
jgi:hypothetical protein